MARTSKAHHRRSIRRGSHDYSGGGAYLVTTCVKRRHCLFGRVNQGEMILNSAGQTVMRVWNALREQFAPLVLDAFQVMPNHVHGIIVIPGRGLSPALARATGAATLQSQTTRGSAPRARGPSLIDIVGAFKSISTIEVKGLLSRTGRSLWLNDHFEHRVRDVAELELFRDYIVHNPQRWLEDAENRDRI